MCGFRWWHPEAIDVVIGSLGTWEWQSFLFSFFLSPRNVHVITMEMMPVAHAPNYHSKVGILSEKFFPFACIESEKFFPFACIESEKFLLDLVTSLEVVFSY